MFFSADAAVIVAWKLREWSMSEWERSMLEGKFSFQLLLLKRSHIIATWKWNKLQKFVGRPQVIIKGFSFFTAEIIQPWFFRANKFSSQTPPKKICSQLPIQILCLFRSCQSKKREFSTLWNMQQVGFHKLYYREKIWVRENRYAKLVKITLSRCRRDNNTVRLFLDK